MVAVTEEDCDDFDSSTVNDMDCDGIISHFDCDDFDSNIGVDFDDCEIENVQRYDGGWKHTCIVKDNQTIEC